MALNKRMAATNSRASDPGVAGVVITGATQTFDPTGRWILVTTAGSFTGRLVEDVADVVYALPVGLHPLAVRSITSVSTLAGVVIL